jgi:hypothetical protein
MTLFNCDLTGLTRMPPVCLLSGLILWSAAWGASAGGSANPYYQIPERNVFGLKPPQPKTAEPAQSLPLPKITLTGIITILGDKRALLRVQPSAQPRAKPGKEESYTLAEGQRDGEIEVLEIDPKTERVKVNNSGTVMEITFEKPSPAASPPSAPTTPSPAPRPRLNPPRLPMQAAARGTWPQ